MRKAGNRVRVTAQLLEAENGAHLWADKYDGDLEDIFDLQDQITERVVAIVEPSLQRSEIERSRRKRPESLEAYDLYLRALPHVAAQMPEEAQKALVLLQQAWRSMHPTRLRMRSLPGVTSFALRAGGSDPAHKRSLAPRARDHRQQSR